MIRNDDRTYPFHLIPYLVTMSAFQPHKKPTDRSRGIVDREWWSERREDERGQVVLVDDAVYGCWAGCYLRPQGLRVTVRILDQADQADQDDLPGLCIQYSTFGYSELSRV